MLRNNWRILLAVKIRATLILLRIVIVALIIAVLGLSVWTSYQSNRNNYAEYLKTAEIQRQQAAEKIASECQIISDPLKSFSNCIESKTAKYIAKQNTEKDLQAQVDMAFWAMLLFLLTAISVILSFIGLYFLYTSLKHTRIAIADNREIGEAQTRAYLGIDTSKSSPISVDKFKVGSPVEIKFHIKNFGNSPAKKFRYAAVCMFQEYPIPHDGIHTAIPDSKDNAPMITIHESGVNICEAFTKDDLGEGHRRIMQEAGDIKMFLIARVDYSDVFRRDQFMNICLYFEPVASAGDGVPFIGQWYQVEGRNDTS